MKECHWSHSGTGITADILVQGTVPTTENCLVHFDSHVSKTWRQKWQLGQRRDLFGNHSFSDWISRAFSPNLIPGSYDPCPCPCHLWGWCLLHLCVFLKRKQTSAEVCFEKQWKRNNGCIIFTFCSFSSKVYCWNPSICVHHLGSLFWITVQYSTV